WERRAGGTSATCSAAASNCAARRSCSTTLGALPANGPVSSTPTAAPRSPAPVWHTVSTQAPEGGARLQTIMAILGHRSPQMAMIYTHFSDTTIRTEYERALASGERVARPALETMLDPMRITDADVDWLKTNFVKTELELGHCLRLPQEG